MGVVSSGHKDSSIKRHILKKKRNKKDQIELFEMEATLLVINGTLRKQTACIGWQNNLMVEKPKQVSFLACLHLKGQIDTLLLTW